MSVLPPLLNRVELRPRTASWSETEAWERVMSLIGEGSFPHCCAMVIPGDLQGEAAVAAAKLLLCDSRRGGDGCGSCASWTGQGHPDLLACGEPMKPPTIAECRGVIQAAAYRPVVSDGRVVVVYSADRMLLPAANSLLKLAEEPPDGVLLLLMVEEEELLLPTLRSRSWIISLPSHREDEGLPPPGTPHEWARWMEDNSASEVDSLAGMLVSWASWEARRGDFERAAVLERLRLVIQTKRLSRTMAFDLIVLVLKEGFVFEHSFGDLW